MKKVIDEAIKLLTSDQEGNSADKARVAIALDEINAKLVEAERVSRIMLTSTSKSLSRIASIAMLAADELRIDNDRVEMSGQDECPACRRPDGGGHADLCIFKQG